MTAFMPFDYDEKTDRYRLCHWCHGKGCMGCKNEAMKEAKRQEAEYNLQFPNGPECVSIPIGKLQDAKEAIGADAILKAFGDGGGGTAEVFDNLERLGFGRPKPTGQANVSHGHR